MIPPQCGTICQLNVVGAANRVGGNNCPELLPKTHQWVLQSFLSTNGQSTEVIMVVSLAE